MRQRWEVDELVESWSLDRDDLSFLGNKSGSTRLGFAVLMKFFELEARFPSSSDEVPVEAADFVARQLGLGFDAWPGEPFSFRTVHAALIDMNVSYFSAGVRYSNPA